MKTNIGVILAAMLATETMAQTAGTPPPLTTPGAPPAAAAPQAVPPATPAPTNKPAAKPKPAPKPAAKKKPATTAAPAAMFSANDTGIVNASTLNVRGHARINSEIVTRLKKGDAVTVIKEITLAKPQTDEPAKWLQIVLPVGTRVWVNGAYVDGSGTVTVKKLNIRTGAGENYSVIGELQKGDSVKIQETKGDWKAIDSPTNAFGYVAAHMLSRKEPAPVIFTPPTTTTLTENQPNVATPTPITTPTPTPTPMPVMTPTPAVDAGGPPPPRIVQREGIVGETVSIQAPTYFEIMSLDTGKPMDYIHSTTTNLVLARYVGKKVLVSGEEELDERWPNTPVLTLQKIQLVK